MAKNKKPDKRKWLSFDSRQNNAIRTNYAKAKLSHTHKNSNVGLGKYIP